VLSEGETIDESNQDLLARFETFAQSTVERFLPGYQLLRYEPEGLASVHAEFFLVDHRGEQLLGGFLIVNGELLLKILLLFSAEERVNGEATLDALRKGMVFRTRGRRTQTTKDDLAPYDVRCGIPASDWIEANACSTDERTAVAHDGEYAGILTHAEIKEQITEGKLGSRSLVFVDEGGPGTRVWVSLPEAGERIPGLMGISDIGERMATFGVIGGGIGALAGLIYGLFFASSQVAQSDAYRNIGSWGEAIVLGGFCLISPLIGLGLIGLGLKGLERDAGNAGKTMLVGLGLIAFPFLIGPMIFGSLMSLIWVVVQWIFWLILMIIVFAALAAAAGVGIGKLTGSRLAPTVGAWLTKLTGERFAEALVTRIQRLTSGRFPKNKILESEEASQSGPAVSTSLWTDG